MVIRTVNKHNRMWYDITNLLNNKLSLATKLIILTTATTCFGLQGHRQVLPTPHYEIKIEDFLSDNNFHTVPSDPTDIFQSQVRNTVI
jgi:hypothetical protein